jgi:ISXO2-like transposase domain
MGYRHIVTNISDSADPAHVVMPRVHRIASLLNRWWLGIHHGAIRPSHLDYYLDEFTFRFNRRSSKARGLLFYRLMEQAVDWGPVSRKKIIGGQSQHSLYGLSKLHTHFPLFVYNGEIGSNVFHDRDVHLPHEIHRVPWLLHSAFDGSPLRSRNVPHAGMKVPRHSAFHG